MNSTVEKPSPGFFGGRIYLLISLIASIPIYIIIDSFLKTIHVQDDEQIAIAFTMCFIIGIFAARYISHSWASNLKDMPVGLVLGLALLIVIAVVWLFIHADFPIQGRDGINLLLFWIPFAVISLALGLLIKIVHTVTQNQLKEARISATHSEGELHLLQSQLGPHFLFNTLNNLYGLSLTQHEKIPPLLLKLSELLRYSVYNTSEIYVPLKDEMAYINNYMEFEKIRIGERLVLTTHLESINDTDLKIAPMLLIVFVENAFKHSKNSAEQQIFIEITLKTFGNSILFAVKNSYSEVKKEQEFMDKDSGFGLNSVTKRLEILYPGQHELEIKKDESSYHVLLQLKRK